MKKQTDSSIKTQLISFFKEIKIVFARITIVLSILTNSTSDINSQSVMKLTSRINELKSSDLCSEKAKGEYLSMLAYDLNPTLKLENGVVCTSTTELPICADIEINSISILYSNNPKFRRIEFLTLRVSDLNNIIPIDISRLAGLNSLKYIHIICNAECSNEFINSLIKNGNPKVQIYYSVSIPN